jgi:antitoxin ParD1/3/4
MPRSFALGDHFEQFIDAQLKSGRYNNASEVVRAGLRLLEDTERPKGLSMSALRRLLAEDGDGGPGLPAAEVLDRLERKYRDMADDGGGE